MKMDRSTLDAIVKKILSPPDFFTEIWSKRPLHVPCAAPECVGVYCVNEFLADMTLVQPPPFIVASVRDGERVHSRHTTSNAVLSAVEAGGVASIKMSRRWHDTESPSNWEWMRLLFGNLCSAACMIYMDPRRSEDVDLFLAGPNSRLGAHYDTTHVFTLQLFGERKWVVEYAVRLDERLAALRDPNYRRERELRVQGPTLEVTLHPGDALYVPAYAVHNVTGAGWSVALSLGLRAFNEIDLVRSVLETIEGTKYVDYGPAASLPASCGESHVEAKLALARRTRSLIKQLETAAIGLTMAELRLPETLSPTIANRSVRSAPSIDQAQPKAEQNLPTRPIEARSPTSKN